jgi:hypothetical protein
MRKKHWSILGLALGVLVLGVLVGLMTVNTVAADPTPGVKIQLPRIDVGDVLGTGPWETWIQVQNVSLPDPITGVEPATGAIFLGWGEYSNMCPTNDPGVIVHYCALIRGNALWTLRTQLAETVHSGIIYSVRADLFTAACSAAEETEGDTDAWRCWKEEWEYGTCDVGPGGDWAPVGGAVGEELAVTVTRYGPNDYGTFVSSTYTGISEEMEGEDPPYNYYAPYLMKGWNGFDTEMTIQNSGQDCTSVWIDYMEQGTCYTVFKQHIEQLAPGEAIRVKVPCNVGEIPCYWLGSAHISAEQPLGIIVDQTSFELPCGPPDQGTLLTYRARPKVEVRDSQIITDTLVYADLIFREWSGWESSIQVQNLSVTSQRTFVTVDFMDNSGDEILFLADWVCPAGSATFYLPAVTDLGFDYIGAAEIQSHDQVSFPGGVTPAQPIFAVVDLRKPRNPPLTEYAKGGSYNAHPYSQKEWVSEIALPFTAMNAVDMYTPWTSMIAIRNNSNCNKLKTKIWFKDETGDLVCELRIPWLMPKHVKLIDLDNVGCLYPGYVGAAKVIVDEFEQLCDIDNDGHADNEPLMPSVIVVEKGVTGIPGDDINIYEGIPYATNIPACYGDILGKVHSYDAGEDGSQADDTAPLAGVRVEPPTGNVDYTDSTGDYEVTDVESGLDLTVTFTRTGYLDGIAILDLDCGEDLVADCELPCMVSITTTVYVSDTDNANLVALVGATVNYSVPAEEYTGADCGFEPYAKSGKTDSVGGFTFELPLFDDDLTFTVTAADPYIEPRTFEKAIMDADSEGTYGITPSWSVVDAPLFTTEPFIDTDCAWNPEGDTTKGISPTILCAYGQFAGLVFVDVDHSTTYTAGDIPAEGVTVTATRVQDGKQWTYVTTANGFYIIQVPTGVLPTTPGGASVNDDGSAFSLQVGATAYAHTFTGCGEAFSRNFAL